MKSVLIIVVNHYCCVVGKKNKLLTLIMYMYLELYVKMRLRRRYNILIIQIMLA